RAADELEDAHASDDRGKPDEDREPRPAPGAPAPPPPPRSEWENVRPVAPQPPRQRPRADEREDAPAVSGDTPHARGPVVNTGFARHADSGAIIPPTHALGGDRE